MFNFKKYFLVFFSMMLLGSSAGADTVIAQDGEGIVYRVSRKSLKEANLATLTYCKKESKVGKCKLIWKSKPKNSGYGSVAQSKTRIQMTTGYLSENEASDVAMQGCVAETAKDDTCSITLTFYDDSHDASSPAANVQSKNPDGKVFRYSDNCYNGDCVRTFEGGRKVRFQAPYCFDGADGAWKWKPDGC